MQSPSALLVLVFVIIFNRKIANTSIMDSIVLSRDMVLTVKIVDHHTRSY
jgi:hypothetical protein